MHENQENFFVRYVLRQKKVFQFSKPLFPSSVVFLQVNPQESEGFKKD